MESKQATISTLRTYAVSDDAKSTRIYLATLFSFLAFIGMSTYCYTINPWLSLIFCLPSGIMLCRFFVLQHDCGHNSYFSKPKYNRIGGIVLGWFTMIPNALWTHIHDLHHGTTGNLDKRHINPGLWQMTVKEYRAANSFKKVLYRFFRSYFMRLVITPVLWMVVGKIPYRGMGRKILTSIWIHNLVYGLILYYIIVNDAFLALIVIYLIPVFVFTFAASVMFFVQHQYDGTYWEDEENWNLYNASIHGSSHVQLGPFLDWVTGSVGCHHVHHLNSRIPYYELTKATTAIQEYNETTTIRLAKVLGQLRMVLWDEETKKMVRFKDV